MKKILTNDIRPGFVMGVLFWVILLLAMKFCTPKPIVKTPEPVQEVLKDSTTQILTLIPDYGNITFGSSSDIDWIEIPQPHSNPTVTPRKRFDRPVLVDTCRLVFVGTQGIKVTRIGDSVIIGFETIEPPVPDHVTPMELLEIQLFDSLYRVDSLKLN